MASAPWYDLVSVRLIPDVSHTLSMSVSEEFDPENVHALQLLYLAADVALTKEFAVYRLRRVIELCAPALERLGETVSDPDSEEREFSATFKASLRQNLAYWRDQSRILPSLSL
ncbi:MAG TPA: hypothetical protein DEO49_06665 [Sutterella sp.]|nr:hypothetical protein [Sutterella sp.]